MKLPPERVAELNMRRREYKWSLILAQVPSFHTERLSVHVTLFFQSGYIYDCYWLLYVSSAWNPTRYSVCVLCGAVSPTCTARVEGEEAQEETTGKPAESREGSLWPGSGPAHEPKWLVRSIPNHIHLPLPLTNISLSFFHSWVEEFVGNPNHGHVALIDLIKDLADHPTSIPRKNAKKYAVLHREPVRSLTLTKLCLVCNQHISLIQVYLHNSLSCLKALMAHRVSALLVTIYTTNTSFCVNGRLDLVLCSVMIPVSVYWHTVWIAPVQRSKLWCWK